ncbi:hypothetical protein HHS_02060 [Candidatus Pantoea carbekii]|uniref:Uncharacterized protein n=1 Tax=Candidatus Pantoea carbekii TaxID=1235990 RepID=U3U249_9GAMM|nr:hypothetical protein HHS_02060 [Candidatus Pantoea carbekii]
MLKLNIVYISTVVKKDILHCKNMFKVENSCRTNCLKHHYFAFIEQYKDNFIMPNQRKINFKSIFNFLDYDKNKRGHSR